MLPSLSNLRGMQERLTGDLMMFAPELILCAAIVLLLLARLIGALNRWHRLPAAIIASALACAVATMQWSQGITSGELFSGMLKLDAWAAWFRAFILLAALLVLILSRLTGLPDAEDSADYAVLVLGSSLGLMLMASANHLLMVFLAVEMAGLPAYVLAGFLKGRPTASEAALKYVIYGAASGGVMLYGISLITARCGTGYLPGITQAIAPMLAAGGFDLAMAAGSLMIAVGIGYKLSVVPFHVWLPDVFEGAAAEVGAFLSVASKAAAVALLGRLVWKLTDCGPEALPSIATISLVLAAVAGITATFGNLAAYRQSNLKRLLGYSTIAHAGFLLAAIAPVTAGSSAAALVYLAAYLLANLGAFAGVAAVRHMSGGESLDDLRGLMARSPLLAVGWVICVLSLLGLPPLAGFAGKFLVFESIYSTAAASAYPTAWHVLFGVLLVNTAIGAGYYLKLLRLAVLEEEAAPARGTAPAALGAFVLAMAIASIALGIFWSPLMDAAAAAVSAFN